MLQREDKRLPGLVNSPAPLNPYMSRRTQWRKQKVTARLDAEKEHGRRCG